MNSEKQLLMNELNSMTQNCLGKLPPQHCTILILIDMAEFSYEEAAAALRIPMGTVKSRLARAHIDLRKRLLDSNYLSMDVPSTGIPMRRMFVNSN